MASVPIAPHKNREVWAAAVGVLTDQIVTAEDLPPRAVAPGANATPTPTKAVVATNSNDHAGRAVGSGFNFSVSWSMCTTHCIDENRARQPRNGDAPTNEDMMKIISFQGKNVLITGASSGIGAALARRFAREKSSLSLVARRQERLDALAAELRSQAPQIRTIVADITQPDAAARIFVDSGPIDILVNNAGAGEYGAFATQDMAALEKMIALNVTGLVRLTHAVLPQMLAQKSGHIVNIASLAGFQPTPYMATYGATKSFVLDFSMSLWAELRESGVGVTCVCPGPVRTEFFDHGGFGSRREDFSQTAADPERLADQVIDAVRNDRALLVPGWRNKLAAVFQRFAPMRTVTKISARLLGPIPK